MDVDKAGILLVGGEEVFVFDYFPVRFLRDGIVWDLVDVSGGSEIVKRLWSFLFVEGKFPDGLAELGKIRAQGIFAGCENRAAISRDHDRKKDRDDAHDDHQLEESETAGVSRSTFHSQLLYASPFRPFRSKPSVL